MVSVIPMVPSEKVHEYVAAETEVDASNKTGDAPQAASGLAVKEAVGEGFTRIL